MDQPICPKLRLSSGQSSVDGVAHNSIILPVGLTDGRDASSIVRSSEINTAKQAGIDGFALNIGPSDPWTNTQLHQAGLPGR